MENSVQNTEYKVYGYRWVILLAYMLITSVNQMMWITFAPITTESVKFYHVSDLRIGMLSMIFMIVYLIMSLPASWAIDTYGIRKGVGIGAVLTGVFGMIRGLVPDNYNLILLSQIGLAVGQPFLLNAITKVAARWFPLKERATAAGLGTLSMYIGILLGMMLTPYLVLSVGISRMLYINGIISVIAMVAFFVLIREKPATAPCSAEQEERALVVDGLKLIFRKRDFNRLLVIFFVALGVFNAVTTWIEQILSPNGFTAVQAGLTGGLMIIGGVLGALVIPLLSDYLRKRTVFIVIALAGATISLIGVTFSTNYPLLLVSGAGFGFFLLSSGPIGFQYGAEVTYPVSEGTSNGFLILMGQVSGILFIFAMDGFKSAKSGSMTRPLVVLILLMAVSFMISFWLRESKLLEQSKKVSED
ncbi:MAG TPA: MFS transporter [Bacteroidales bacterium]|nr:MFS transporter [Bacteroidales bacterium]